MYPQEKYKHSYMSMHSSVIHNSLEVETTQMSPHRWMDDQNVARMYTGMWLGKKGMIWSMPQCEWPVKWKPDAKWKKPGTKATYCVIPFPWNSQRRKIYGERVEVVDRDWRREKWVVTADVYGMSFGSDEHVLKLDGGDVCTALWIYENCWTVHFKRVNYMVCESQ